MKPICLIFFNVVFFYVTDLNAQIVNEGILKIQPSTTVYFGDEYTNKNAGSHINNGDLHLNNNFVNDGATDSSSGTTYFDSSVNSVQYISGKRFH